MSLKFPEQEENAEDDEILTYCADGEVIWKNEIEAILAGETTDSKDADDELIL